MKRWSKSIAILTAVALMASGCGLEVAPVSGNGEETTGPQEGVRQVILAGDEADLNIRPQDDFYGYVNAEHLWEMTVPYGESTMGGFVDAMFEIDDQLNGILQEVVQGTYVSGSGSSTEAAGNAVNYAKGSSEQLIQTYYDLFKAKKYTDKSLFDDMFGRIDEIQSVEDLIRVSCELSNEYGIWSFYDVMVETDAFNPSRQALALPMLDTFQNNLKKLYEDDDAVEKFRNMLSDSLQGLGADHDDAQDRADRIAYLWIDIAAETDFDAVNEADTVVSVTSCSLEEVAELIPGGNLKEILKWKGLKEQEINELDHIYVLLPEQRKAAMVYLTPEYLEVWKDYLRCCICGTFSQYLPEEYTLNDMSVLEKEATDEDIFDHIKYDLYNQVSELYYEKYYTEELAEYMSHMEADFKSAYIKMIRQADWLSSEGRELFVEKFENIHFFFGGQSWRNEDVRLANLNPSSVFEMALKLQKLNTRQQYESLLRETDITKWGMGAQEVNAYYSPSVNSIYVTIGILHAPFFDLKADYSTNLGGVGAVICHELSHAFDNNGIRYDKDGMYRPDWVPQADREAFAKVVDSVDAYYDNYALLDVYHVDGEKTVGENLADLGSVQCLLSLTKTKNQRKNLFENYARIWCTLYQKDDLIAYLTQDVHSPDIVRVNAVLSSMDEFYETYDVTEGDGMYVQPEGRVKRW